jgi:hypothetical protein
MLGVAAPSLPAFACTLPATPKVVVIGIGSDGISNVYVPDQQANSNSIADVEVTYAHIEYGLWDASEAVQSNKIVRISLDDDCRGDLGTTAGSMLKLTDEVRSMMKDASMVILISNFGTCIGTAVTPIVARLARMAEVKVVVGGITPFGFEGALAMDRTQRTKQLVLRDADELRLFSRESLFNRMDDPIKIEVFYFNELIAISEFVQEHVARFAEEIEHQPLSIRSASDLQTGPWTV